MDILYAILGFLLIALVLFDLFASVIVPRPIPSFYLMSGYVRRYTWKWWRGIFFPIQPPAKREIVLGFFAPLSVLMVLAVWLLGLIIGYGLVFYALAQQIRPIPTNLGDASYFAGSTLLTIGYGDFAPVGGTARAVAIAAGATGLATVAIVLAYLFLLFNAYRAREVFEVTLDARAGAPPSGVALLEINAELETLENLPDFFESAQRWCADVLETHLAYPVLCYFRSAHVGESWIAALGAILDAATLVISTVEGLPKGQARLTHSVGSHLVSDVAKYFRLLGDDNVLVERSEFRTARERLAAAEFRLVDEAEAWQTFCTLRSEYASSLNNLARALAIEPAQWIGDRSPLGARTD